jgi:hypothetical protein
MVTNLRGSERGQGTGGRTGVVAWTGMWFLVGRFAPHHRMRFLWWRGRA